MFYMILYGLPKISYVHLLYSFIHAFIPKLITKYYWQNVAKPLAKAFRKTSVVVISLKKRILRKIAVSYLSEMLYEML